MAIQRIEQFIASLNNANVDISALCANELSYLRNEYRVKDESNENGIYGGLATYKRAITNYRKALFELSPNHPAREFFKMNKADSVNIVYQNGKSAMRNYVNRSKGIMFEINNPAEYIKTAIGLLNAVSYIDNILGIAALTGRRVNEVGYSSEFDYCEYDDMYSYYHPFEELLDFEQLDFIKVYGLSKKQTYLNNKHCNDTGIIPVLADIDLIFNAVSELRKTRTFDNADDFHNKASKAISAKVKKHFDCHLGNKCSGHDLRKAYARLCFDMLKKPSVYQDDGLHAFAETALSQKLPDNYMKFS